MPPPALLDNSNSKHEQVQKVLTWLTTGSSTAAASVATAAAAAAAATQLPRAATPKTPLHVQILPPTGTARQAIASFVLRAALILLAVSAVSALLDERGLGRGRMGGLNANSKHVQEADGDL